MVSPSEPDHDTAYMAMALALARRGLGRVWPNPAVGCVIVRDGVVVGRGWTQPGGRPHAETEALRRAGAAARGATAYVTLEPCDHVGRTPPCSLALIAAGIARVVVALVDPDPRVRGKGIRRLQEAGLRVDVGVGATLSRDVNRGFLSRVERDRPIFLLKAAASVDGRTATATGDSQWITGPDARADGHRLRLSHDVILVGRGTVARDDPALTCRLPGAADRSPIRVVVDSRLRLPLERRVFRPPLASGTWVVTGVSAEGQDKEREAKKIALADLGVVVLEVATEASGRVDLTALARALGARGITRVLVEGGATLATASLRAGLVGSVMWYRGPQLLGATGLAAVGDLDNSVLAECPKLISRGVRRVGSDLVEAFDVGGASGAGEGEDV